MRTAFVALALLGCGEGQRALPWSPPPVVTNRDESWAQCYYIHQSVPRLGECLRYHGWDSALSEQRMTAFRDSVRAGWEAYYTARPRQVYYHRFEADSPAFYQAIRREFQDQLVEAAVDRALDDR